VKGALRTLFRLLSSRGLTALLVGLWAFGYACFSIWSEEAFSRFAFLFQRFPAVQAVFWLFVFNLLLRNAVDIRNRFRYRPFPALLAAVLPVGVIVLLTGFGLSLGQKQVLTTVVGPGETLRTPWNTVFSVTHIDTGLKDRILDLENTSNVFFKYEPSMTVEYSGRTKRITAFPPTRLGGDFVHILRFGIGPEIALSRNGRVFRREFHALRFLPPPGTNRVRLPPLPYEFQIKLEPSKTYHVRGELANEYDIAHPRFRVRVLEDGKELAAGVPDPLLRFLDLEISFPRWEPWALVDVARDPGIVPVAAGLVMVCLGLPLWLVSLPRLLAGHRAAREHSG